MALEKSVGAFSSGTGAVTTTIEINTGFEPKAIIFWWTGITGTIDAVGSSDVSQGVGFACGTTNRRCAGWATTDGQSTSVTGRINRNDACVATISGAGSVLGLLDISSFDADGFTLVVDDQFPASIRIHYMALGGDTITNATTGEFDMEDGDVTQPVVVGFEPNAILLSSTLFASSTQGTIGLFGFGAATAPDEAAVIAIGDRTGIGDQDANSYCRMGECMAILDSTQAGGPVDMRAEFNEFNTDNGGSFELNWVETGFTGTRLCNYLALAGASVKVGSLSTEVGTSTEIPVDLGFTPEAVMFVSAARTESIANSSSAHAHFSMGAATGPTERGAQAAWDEDFPSPSTSASATAVEHDAVYINIAADDTVQARMDVQSFDSNGFTCIMDTADIAQNFVWYMAFGEPSGGGGSSAYVPGGMLRLGIG